MISAIVCVDRKGGIGKKNGKKKKNKPRRSIFGTIMRFIGCLLCVCVMAASAGAVLLSLYVVQVTASFGIIAAGAEPACACTDTRPHSAVTQMGIKP